MTTTLETRTSFSNQQRQGQQHQQHRVAQGRRGLLLLLHQSWGRRSSADRSSRIHGRAQLLHQLPRRQRIAWLSQQQLPGQHLQPLQRLLLALQPPTGPGLRCLQAPDLTQPRLAQQPLAP